MYYKMQHLVLEWCISAHRRDSPQCHRTMKSHWGRSCLKGTVWSQEGMVYTCSCMRVSWLISPPAMYQLHVCKAKGKTIFSANDSIVSFFLFYPPIIKTSSIYYSYVWCRQFLVFCTHIQTQHTHAHTIKTKIADLLLLLEYQVMTINSHLYLFSERCKMVSTRTAISNNLQLARD